jgi:hypothetical protein
LNFDRPGIDQLLPLDLLSEALEEPKALSILELKGLGKDLWKGIDAAGHVRRERASWD